MVSLHCFDGVVTARNQNRLVKDGPLTLHQNISQETEQQNYHLHASKPEMAAIERNYKMKLTKSDVCTKASKTTYTLKIIHQNVDRLANKIDRLVHFLDEKEPDIVLLTEHGLSEEKLYNTRLAGYSLVGGFSRKSHLKGGVAAYARLESKQSVRLIHTSRENSELVCEVAIFEIQNKHRKMILFGIYRPPKASIDQSLEIIEELLERTASADLPLVIMGDINIDNNIKDGNNQTKLAELLTCYNAIRLDLPNTRKDKTSIDLVCTNLELQNLTVSVIESGLSDHTAQEVLIKSDKLPISGAKNSKRMFKTKNIEHLQMLLANQDWSKVLSPYNINYNYEIFHRTLQNLLDIASPITKTRGGKKPKKRYWDEESTALRNVYIKALEKEACTGRAEDKAQTAAKKKAYDLKLKALRKQNSANFIAESDNKSKAVWSIINQERKEKISGSETNLCLETSQKALTDPQEVANHLNNYFATVADRTLHDNLTTKKQKCTRTEPKAQKQLYLSPTNQKEILTIIDSLKPKTSAGMDDMSSKLVKACKLEMVAPLTVLINQSLQEGIFPDRLKITKVYPKFKSGLKTDAASYRPISLISTFSKIIEKVVLSRLTKYLDQNNLLTDRQHGFLKGRSTTTAIIQLIESIIDGIEEGHIVTGLFLDFSKAFDCLDHNLLLEKLNNLGITGTSAKWFHSYLSNRTQQVELKYITKNTTSKVLSTPLPVQRGVPQGSVLGPVLFLLLTNDMPSSMDDICETVMYADDTTLILKHKLEEQLDIKTFIAFNTAKQYCYENDLVLNEKKTVQITFSTRPKISVGLPELEDKDTTKYLGIILDEKLNWTPHINNLCKKLSTGTYVIRRIKQVCDAEAARTAYFALFESHLRYGLAAWGGSSNSNLERVLLQQKRVIRCLAGIGYRDSCRQAFRDLRILTVVSLYIAEVILHTISSSQPRHEDKHHHQTRNAGNFQLQLHRLSLFSKKPSYKGALYFNLLPQHLKTTTGTNFKRDLIQWLLHRPCYHEKDFLNWKDVFQLN